VLKYF